MTNIGFSMPFPLRLIVLLCLALAPGLKAAETPTGDFSAKAAITQRLQQTQIELQQHASDSDRLTHELLKRLESMIYHHQASLDFLAAKKNEYERATEAELSWAGFDQPGPYSVLFSDELRMQLVSLQDQQRGAETRLLIITRAIRDSADQLSAYQRKERELSETAESEEATESRQRILVLLQQNDISSQTEVEKVAYLELRQRGVQAEIATFTSGQALVALQLAAIKGQVTFSQTELDNILTRIRDERTQTLETLDAAGGDVLGFDARIAWLAEFLDTEERFWKTRYLVFSDTSQVKQNNALESFREMNQMIDFWAQAGKTLAAEQLPQTSEDSEGLVLRDELKRINRLKNRLDFVISELEGTASPGFLFLDYVVSATLAIWDTELYLVEDTTSFEGKKVTTYRAITNGKLIKLAIILIVGWFTLKFLSRRLRKLANHYLGSSTATVNSIVRWAFGVGLGVLIIYALKSVNIPFTAFAFLGGTLAIGIGFGAQTLVKNFISGIMLILERPFKVGDYIEVDNVTGQIKRIGMRASVIEHFDGIETLVPNSVLLDNRVDNWTFGKTAIRGSVHVGVAYGSSTREVSRTMLASALEHGQVLDRPEPEVRLEDFGDDALIFRLLYWVDATKTQRERLDSDLRFMIHKGLKEARITIAFPQRDIHFDSTQPLQVEVSSHSAAEKPGIIDE